MHIRAFWSCKRDTPKLQIYLNYSYRVLELHEVLELGCLTTKLSGVGGVQLQNYAK
jgi:hypothetical protein